jgi:hypothetical protein
MIEIVSLIGNALGIIVDKGMDHFMKSSELNLLKDAIAEKIRREMRFNNELLGAIIEYQKKNDLEKVSRIIKVIDTSGFDSLDNSSIPLKAIFRDSKIEWEIIYRDFKHGKGYRTWVKNIDNVPLLVERIYHRLKIIKAFENIGLLKGQSSLRYVIFLIRAYQYFEAKKK